MHYVYNRPHSMATPRGREKTRTRRKGRGGRVAGREVRESRVAVKVVKTCPGRFLDDGVEEED